MWWAKLPQKDYSPEGVNILFLGGSISQYIGREGGGTNVCCKRIAQVMALSFQDLISCHLTALDVPLLAATSLSEDIWSNLVFITSFLT